MTHILLCNLAWTRTPSSATGYICYITRTNDIKTYPEIQLQNMRFQINWQVDSYLFIPVPALCWIRRQSARKVVSSKWEQVCTVMRSISPLMTMLKSPLNCFSFIRITYTGQLLLWWDHLHCDRKQLLFMHWKYYSSVTLGLRNLKLDSLFFRCSLQTEINNFITR